MALADKIQIHLSTMSGLHATKIPSVVKLHTNIKYSAVAPCSITFKFNGLFGLVCSRSPVDLY